MKNTCSSSSRNLLAFTLTELLVVISIIAVLAGLLLPALARARLRAQVSASKLEMNNLAAAIKQYEAAYSRFPASTAAFKSINPNAGLLSACPDFTFGMLDAPHPGTPANAISITNSGQSLGFEYQADNSEVIAILMDLTNYPDGTPTINTNHIKNPQGTKFLEVKMASDKSSPGVGTDLVYRDPWGNPYIITLDMNGDNKCRDAFYRLKRISQQQRAQGFNGLVNNADPTGNSDAFEANTAVMIWSLGPDGQVDPGISPPANSPPANAGSGANRDNILIWK